MAAVVTAVCGSGLRGQESGPKAGANRRGQVPADNDGGQRPLRGPIRQANGVDNQIPRDDIPFIEGAPAPDGAEFPPAGWPAGFKPESLVTPGGLSGTLNLLVLLTVLSLAPSILIMTTCFIRFVIVFGLLRQALGTQQLPPNQVVLGLSLFMTLFAMTPVWTESYEQGIRPYTSPAEGEEQPSLRETFDRTVLPIRRFMTEQIHHTGNGDTVLTLLEYQRPDPETPAGRAYRPPRTYDDVPLTVILPAYMISELKSAFIIGFQIYLPFLIIDMVVSVVLMSMGMMMLPPTLISFPFKLLLFVLIDGWSLTVGMLLESVLTH
jgi:flagellar biosynthetic protein FliP